MKIVRCKSHVNNGSFIKCRLYKFRGVKNNIYSVEDNNSSIVGFSEYEFNKFFVRTKK